MTDDVQKFRAEGEFAGSRVDKWLVIASEFSRARIQKFVASGRLKCDGVVVDSPSAKVQAEAIYTLEVPPPVDDVPVPENIPLDIYFEDAHLLVVNKPAGMTVHPAPGSRSGTLVHALLYHAKDSLSGIGGVLRPGIVHRIDKDTSGLLVVAKHDKAHHHLSRQFAKHTVNRTYTSFVRSAPAPRSGRVESRIARSPQDRKKQAVVRGTWNDMMSSEHGRHAVTNYTFIQGFGQKPKAAIGTPLVSQIECRLETGRTHQIRVHMAHLGCPLLGDPLYGKQRAFKTSNAETEVIIREAVAKLGRRQALHAGVLGFIHPVSKEDVLFEAPLPDDLAHLITELSRLSNV